MRLRPCGCLAILLTLAVSTTQPLAADDDATRPDRQDQTTTGALTSVPDLPRSIHDPLQSRDFEAAVTAIDQRLQADPPFADVAALLYLKGRTLTELARYDDAVAVYEQIEQDHAESRWVSRARFGRADIYVRSRNYLAAGQVYQQEAERLLSRGRKDELAAIYLEFADRYFEGIPADDPSQAKQPDYEQALTYYREAVQLKPTAPVQRMIEFRIARCLEELSNWGEAIDAYESFLKSWADEKTPDEDRAPPAVVAEAHYRLGHVQLSNNQAAAARRTWTDFLADVPPVADDDADDADEADDDEKPGAVNWHARAAYELPHTYGLPAPPTPGDLELAVALAERFLEQYPEHELAPKSELEIARGYLHHGRYEPAVARLKALIANDAYADSEQVPLARQLLGQSYLAQQSFDEAIAAFKVFLEEHPTDTNWADVQRQIVTAEFQKAAHARSEERYDDARRLWETFLNKYPLDPRAPAILYYFGQMKAADAAQQHRDRLNAALDAGESAQAVDVNDAESQLYEQAIADWRKLVSKYPDSNEASRAALMIGITLEEKLGRLKEALEAYKQVAGHLQSQAHERITRLTEPLLEIVTERKFRSDEVPRIRLITRNLEDVSVKVYRVDMTDYFRKMHLATGIEALDIALIDPDEQFEHQIDGYEKYRRIDADVEIPLGGPGVTAVTVSSDKLEATTMVIVSDLDIIVKSSRNELFVFAQNMLTGQPVADARLLISDGSEVFAEELTGEDGVLQHTYDQLKDSSDLRAFAIHEGHMASSVTSLDGLDFASGLTPRGYLYTDRPAYRAGQLVNIKGIVRWVAADRLTFTPGEKYTLDIYDARSRLLSSKEVALNDYGTIAGNFMLPGSAPQGTYRVHLHRPAGARRADLPARPEQGDDSDRTDLEVRPTELAAQSYETTFQVTEYRLEPVRLNIDLDKTVLFRGEEVIGSISLAYYYGSPLADEEITYTFGSDGEQVTARTDDEGKVAITLDTQQFNESQPVLLQVHYPARNLQTALTVFIATRGFEASVATLRDVYINGETFAATVKLADPAGEPVATDITLDVYERTNPGFPQKPGVQARGERLVTSYELTTDDDGTARQTLTIDEPGRYVVRATGTDQFGNRISGETAVHISGEKDAVRLRILAEQHHYKVGDEAKVRLHWREDAALALVTYDGAEVLGYQLVELNEGENELQLPMTAELAPNFTLSVAVMDRNRFHTADAPFEVSQKLNIAITPARTEAQPGEAVEVTITATDPQGNPVQAELSFGLVQANLLGMFSDVQGAIDTFFGSGKRTSSVRQTSSCTFRYAPTTSGIHATLLAEQQRRQRLQREIRALAEVEEAELLVQRWNPIVRDGRHFWMELAGPELAAIDGLSNNLAYDFDADGAIAERLYSEFGVELSLGAPINAPMSGDGSAMGRASGMGGFGGGGGIPFRQGSFEYGAPEMGEFLVENATQAGGATSGRALGLGEKRLRELDRMQTRVYPVGDMVVPIRKGGFSSIVVDVERFDDLNRNGNIDLYDLTQQSTTNFSAINGAGVLLSLNGRSEAELQQLIDNGLTLLPGMADAETGFWEPAIVTGEDGTATITLTMPQRSTAWSLRAKGINGQALAGETAVDLVTKKDLFGEITLPLAFTAGDEARIPIEVHNSLDGARQITVKLTTTIGEKATELTRTIDVEGPGIETVSLPVIIDEGESATFELNVSSTGFQPVLPEGDEAADSNSNAADNEPADPDANNNANRDGLTIRPTDTLVRTVPIHAYGAPVFATAGGTAAQSTLSFVEFAEGVPAQGRSLEIRICPSINQSLIDAVLGGRSELLYRCLPLPASEVERAASDILGGVAVLAMIDASRETQTPHARGIAGQITAAIAQLITSQRDDGGWNWRSDPNQGQADVLLSSRVMWALSEARRAGFAVAAEQYGKGQNYLTSTFANAVRTDLESQAVLLQAMAQSNCADFALLNRLYRERNALSGAGLLHLTLAFAALDRKEMAIELLQLFETARADSLTQPSEPKLPWMNDLSERRALYLLALQQLDPASPRTAEIAQQLMAARIGSRWPIAKTDGPAIMALARWHARTRHAGEKYELTVFVNDNELQTLTIDPSTDGARQLSVPAEMLVDDRRQRINFDLTGRGEFTYSVVMSGFVPTDQLKSTDPDLTVKREYYPAERMFNGKPVPRGFGVLTGSYKTFTNPFTQVPVGERGEVVLRMYRRNISSDPGRHNEPLVVVEPIPAGCTVLEGSVSGDRLVRHDIEPGRITFYLGGHDHPGYVQYTLVGYVPGEFRTAPTILRNLYDPARMAVAAAKDLTVLPQGEESADPYRLTPTELYHLGFAHFEQGEMAEAHQLLSELMDNWRLDAAHYKEAARALFTTSLKAGDHGGIVKYFEVIKEQFPDIEVSFADILKVALSYRELGEYERSYLVYRMTVQGAFERESQVAGFLNERGEFVRSVNVLEDLLLDYPAEAYIATAAYALAQEVYRKAPQAADDPKLVEASLTRVHLIAAAIRMLDHFLTTWPRDPAADQASFALANALLDLEQYETAIARAESYAERYPQSRLLDSYWYIIGYSHFALKQPEQALEMCRKVAEASFANPETGGQRPADNRWEAIYIMGQVYHSLGRAAQAIAEYTRVADRFADAMQAIEFFSRKAITLDEVTTLEPEDPRRVDLQFRNIAEASIKVYRIDLMKFGLMQRNLDRITAINLAGIKPYHEQTVELGDGNDYRDRTHELTLPLEEEGAYLVVCRGENLYASGLVLVTPLSLQVQEDPTSGRVRVTVRDATRDQFLDDVHVKVIGSANEEFDSGETDLRGLFIADDIKGTSTIIARADAGEYAFYRGELALQGVTDQSAEDADKPQSQQSDAAPPEPASQEQLLRGNLFEQNSIFQQEQRQNYDGLLNNDRSGIRTKEAY
jgi:alpha-2-macroglobulin